MQEDTVELKLALGALCHFYLLTCFINHFSQAEIEVECIVFWYVFYVSLISFHLYVG